jgi:Fanconi anemia group M protein
MSRRRIIDIPGVSMTISLRHWSPKEGLVRVYVGGIGSPGARIYLMRRHGQVMATIDEDSSGLRPDAVLAAVQGLLPGGLLDWDALVALAKAKSEEAPKRRGVAPGTRASSRFGREEALNGAALDGRWTLEDAAAIGAEMRANQIPEPTRLMIDNREPGRMVDLLRAVENLELSVGNLEVGDYVVPDRLIIERKTVQDFITSITADDKRIFHQTEAMANSEVMGVLLIEGDIYAQQRMTLPQLAGALSFIAVIQRVSVIPTLGLEHSAMLIAKLVRHAVHGLGYDLGLRGSAPRDPASAAAFLLEGLPGVSATRARALLAHFGSLQAVALAGEPELRKIEGIGPKTAKIIAETFSTRHAKG